MPYSKMPNIIDGFKLNLTLCSINATGAPVLEPNLISISPDDVARTYAMISNIDITDIISKLVGSR